MFFIRLFSSITQYMIVANANVYLDIVSNIILVTGLRSFLAFSPFVVFLFHQWAYHTIFIAAILGCVFVSINIMTIGAILIGFGLSISGFLVRKKLAETASGASMYRIAVHTGSIIAGLMVALLYEQPHLFWLTCIVYLLICFVMVTNTKSVQTMESESLPKTLGSFFHHSPQRHFAWIFIGISMGIRALAAYITVPQYLIKIYGVLPMWYGFLLALYSCFVILAQFPSARKKAIFSLKQSLCVLFLACLLLLALEILSINNFSMLVFWLLLLAIQEIFSGTLDAAAEKENTLLTKEIAVSIGAGLSVIVMRLTHDPLWIGLLGCLSLICGSLIHSNSHRFSTQYSKEGFA